MVGYSSKREAYSNDSSLNGRPARINQYND